MFTGIIEEQGIVEELESRPNLVVLKVFAKKIIKGTRIGDSISVNGVCLTVSAIAGRTMIFEVMKETINVTALKQLRIKEKVNLERAMKAGGRFGGHMVTGHVDGIGVIQNRVSKKNYEEFRISLPSKLLKYLVSKGSVAIDGVSLTVGEFYKNGFSVYLIPHTLKATTLGTKKNSDCVNIETDILAKYILNRSLKKR